MKFAWLNTRIPLWHIWAVAKCRLDLPTDLILGFHLKAENAFPGTVVEQGLGVHIPWGWIVSSDTTISSCSSSLKFGQMPKRPFVEKCLASGAMPEIRNSQRFAAATVVWLLLLSHVPRKICGTCGSDAHQLVWSSDLSQKERNWGAGLACENSRNGADWVKGNFAVFFLMFEDKQWFTLW